MNANGSWKVTLSTKLGAQDIQLHISTDGNHLDCLIESPMGNMDVQGTVSGNSLSRDMKISKPIPMKARYEIEIDGDTMSGTAKLGFLGKAKLSGVRIAGSKPMVEHPNENETSTALLITEEFSDPDYHTAYIETDEWREQPVRHRYVHGGFANTGARFSFYFPSQEQYQGRFFHNTYPLALSSDIGPFPIPFAVATGNLGFTIDSGAYYVQTNLGGTDRTPMADPAIAAYRVNAAAAKYTRVLAAEMYGDHRPYGYLFGGSGGSYQVIGSAENTVGVWDGFVPFVMAVPNAIPSMFTVRMHALRVLGKRNRFPRIMDAVNPGGSGDPYQDLNEEESAALREATAMGFPLRGWYNHDTMTSGYFSHVAPLVPMLDPEYNHDFWHKPGYLGTDTAAALNQERHQFDTTVTACLDGFLKSLVLAELPTWNFADAHLVVLTGASAGNSIPIAGINGNRIEFQLAADQLAISNIQPGDKVRIDNAWALALQTYHRHQVPDFATDSDMIGWNQFRDATGKPVYPQRDILIGPLSAAGTAGSIPNGNIKGKMLAVQTLMDIDALPWQADWYRKRVEQHLGSNSQEQFALWYVDHAQHDNPANNQANAHTVSFEGVLQQALRDLSNWVENDVKPTTTDYEVVDSQVIVANDISRGGIQPALTFTVNGKQSVTIDSGQEITFSARIELPEHSGKIVAIEWDFEGIGTFPYSTNIDSAEEQAESTITQVFTRPGTYFAVVRATSQRQGDTQTPYCRIQNIARVRVTVR